MQMLGNGLVVNGQHQFDEAGHPGRRFQVPHVGFDGTHHQFIAALFTINGVQRGQLDGITQWGTGTVSLNIGNLFGFQARIFQRRTQYLFLRQLVGSGNTLTFTILINGRSTHHSQYIIAIA